jgi:hypothetical protein
MVVMRCKLVRYLLLAHDNYKRNILRDPESILMPLECCCLAQRLGRFDNRHPSKTSQ